MPEHPVEKTEAEWKAQLGDAAYHVLRRSGTERPFTGEFCAHEALGTYACRGCGHELFATEQKYHSGCGWPSFWSELATARIEKRLDQSHGMVRVELLCPNCGGHLGHVFNDGPPPTGVRYCINSLSLSFIPRP